MFFCLYGSLYGIYDYLPFRIFGVLDDTITITALVNTITCFRFLLIVMILDPA